MLSSLAREAAELLWEMVATEDIGDAMQQMRENATTIQVLTCHRRLSGLAVCVLHLGYASLQRALTAWLPAHCCAGKLPLPRILHAPRSGRCSCGADGACARAALTAASAALDGPAPGRHDRRLCTPCRRSCGALLATTRTRMRAPWRPAWSPSTC